MSSDKEINKLGAEELSKRAAPISTPIVIPMDPTVDPTTTEGGGDESVALRGPGKSGPVRDKPFWKYEQ